MIKKCILTVLGVSAVTFGLMGYGFASENNSEPTINAGNYSEYVVEVESPNIRQAEWQAMGYSDMFSHQVDLDNAKNEVVGMADEYISLFNSVITDEQSQLLRDYENEMANAVSFRQYNKYKAEFEKIAEECDAAMAEMMAVQPVYNNSNSGSSGGNYSNDPYNFKFMGILQDSNYLYSYYSSNVLRHYKTNEWTAGSDGLYRNSSGQVIVASDDYPKGTVIQSDIFGECIVEDTGVGSSGKLDVYTNF